MPLNRQKLGEQFYKNFLNNNSSIRLKVNLILEPTSIVVVLVVLSISMSNNTLTVITWVLGCSDSRLNNA